MNTPTTPHFIRPCTWVWLILIALTLITYTVGESGLGGVGITLLVLGIAAIKVQMVGNYFMGLRRTRWLWRGVMLGWLVLVVALITIAYLRTPRINDTPQPQICTTKATTKHEGKLCASLQAG